MGIYQSGGAKVEASTATAPGREKGSSVMGKQHGKLKQRLSTLITGDYDYARPRRGEVREAVILSIGENDMVVDLGAKQDGIILPRDLELLDDAYRAGLKAGDHVHQSKWKQNHLPQMLSKAEHGWVVLLGQEVTPSIHAVENRLRRLLERWEWKLAPDSLRLAHTSYPVFGEKMPELEVIFPCARGSGLSGTVCGKS